MLYGKAQVVPVPVGEGGQGDGHVRNVDALVIGECAAGDDGAVDVLPGNFIHPQLHKAVVDEDAAAALRKEFTDALDNDLNTSLAITAVYDVLKAKVNDKTKAMLLREFETVLGLGLFEEAAKAAGKKPAEAGESDPEIDALIAERQAARKNKDFAAADRIRDELAARGIVLTDTPEGVKWHRA